MIQLISSALIYINFGCGVWIGDWRMAPPKDHSRAAIMTDLGNNYYTSSSSGML